MLNDRNISFTNFYLILFLFLVSFKIITCQNNYYSLSDGAIFNDILTFENYLVNNFAKNNNGDFVISFTEYSESIDRYRTSSRKFYGLQNNGQYFFSDEDSFIREYSINIDEETYNNDNNFNLDKSKNLFVSIYDNTDNQCLFCINAYNSMVELYDINNRDNMHYIWSFNNFFNLNQDNDYSSFSYDIFSLKQEMAYIIAFIPRRKSVQIKQVIFLLKNLDLNLLMNMLMMN